jgi:hypothetical protein
MTYPDYNIGTVVRAYADCGGSGRIYDRFVKARPDSWWGLTPGNIGVFRNNDLQVLEVLSDGYKLPIEEPLGKMAVVRDNNGDLWVRADTTDGLNWLHYNDPNDWRNWKEIGSPTEVLYEGVE